MVQLFAPEALQIHRILLPDAGRLQEEEATIAIDIK